MTTKIDWCDESIGGAKLGLFGCSPAHSGCDHCWSPPMFTRFKDSWGVPDGITKGHRWTGKVVVDYDRIGPAFASLPKRAGLRVFVPSNVDLFHPDVEDYFVLMVFAEMERRPDQTFIVLTKRPERVPLWWDYAKRGFNDRWPPNVWIGCSISTPDDLPMVDDLIKVPAAVRFISFEPLLAPVEFDCYQRGPGYIATIPGGSRSRNWDQVIHWCVVGVESGPRRRRCPDSLVMDVQRQCVEDITPCFVKQLDRPHGVIHADHEDWPAWARQDFPEVTP